MRESTPFNPLVLCCFSEKAAVARLGFGLVTGIRPPFPYKIPHEIRIQGDVKSD